MNTITHQLTLKVSQAFAACGYDAKLGIVSVSDRLDLCQFQCNGALAGAKLYKKAPLMIANEILPLLEKDPAFRDVQVVAPGFINLNLQDAYLIQRAKEIASSDQHGIPQLAPSKTILLDYGGPNIAKPLHIGHLRSAVIGEALKRLAKAMGQTVIADIHMGDWGLQMGLVIAEMEVRYPHWNCFQADYQSQEGTVPSFSADELNEIYPFASKKSKENPEFKQTAQAITASLQKGHAGYRALWKEIVRISVCDLKQNYEALDVSFDLWYGESDAQPYLETLFEVLEEKKLLEESEGAMVVSVVEEDDKAPMPPVIIKKSDDSSIYATTDLATIIQREKDFHPDEIWYVVDNRQGLHFTQVFRCAKKAALIPAETAMLHLGFGTMNGSDGKPYKTRDGQVMQLSALLNKVYETAKTNIQNNTEENLDMDDIARKLSIAAIKFGDLMNHRTKDYQFDIDKFLSMEGKTGAYLLYTVARMNSILKKLPEEQTFQMHDVYSTSDRELLLTIILGSEAFQKAYQEKAPNYICEHAYQLAVAFSKFYHENHIVREQDPKKKQSWINLCILTRTLLLTYLNILGIEAVERM